MPRWSDGLVDAFPVPEEKKLSLDKLTIHHEPLSQLSKGCLPFFDLPADLRNRIYILVLFSKPIKRGSNSKRKTSRTSVLLASKQFYQEASYALYTTQRFLIFPIQTFHPLPTVQELPAHYRDLVSNIEMIVGSSWTDPPKSWKMTKSLERCLKRMKNAQTLSIFIEFDPSHPVMKVKRQVHEHYTEFVGKLVETVLKKMPQLEYVQLDGNPGVEVDGSLVSRMRQEAEAQHRSILWGTKAGWTTQTSNQAAEFRFDQ